MSVELFPGSALAPDVLLHQALEDMADVAGVIVLKIDAKGVVDVSMSRMSLERLTFATLKLQLFTERMVLGQEPEETTETAPPRGVA